jgi:hypothetical protein
VFCLIHCPGEGCVAGNGFAIAGDVCSMGNLEYDRLGWGPEPISYQRPIKGNSNF